MADTDRSSSWRKQTAMHTPWGRMDSITGIAWRPDGLDGHKRKDTPRTKVVEELVRPRHAVLLCRF